MSIKILSRFVAEQSIYAYLEGKLGLHIAYAQKEITIDPATNRDKILMDIENDQHVVSVKSKHLCIDRGDRTKFSSVFFYLLYQYKEVWI